MPISSETHRKIVRYLERLGVELNTNRVYVRTVAQELIRIFSLPENYLEQMIGMVNAHIIILSEKADLSDTSGVTASAGSPNKSPSEITYTIIHRPPPVPPDDKIAKD